MSVRFHLRRYLAATLVSTTLAIFATATSTALSQEDGRANEQQQEKPQQQAEQRTDSKQAPEKNANQSPPERQTAKAPDERADAEAPALGVLTGSCPGKAVCIKGTIPHSPAAEAGIEAGDYILSVDGKEVTSPVALRKLIASQASDAEVTLKVWRQGEEMDCKVQLASKADQLPKSHDAWLGVMLASDGKEGVRIDHIVPGSPASESDLREGDTLVKIKNDEIKDAEAFVEKVEELGPGDELKIKIRRDGEEKDVTVTLGSFGDAPIAFLRHLHSHQSDSSQADHQSEAASIHLLEGALDNMRQQMRELRNEVRELKGDKAEGQAKPAKGKGDDVSMLAVPSALGLVSQIQLRLGGAIGQQRGYFGGNNYGRNNPYRSYYGGNFNNYGSRYSPYSGDNYNRYQGNNSYYYRYGGRPYYYGGNSNWYGNRPRSGIQLGPNAGIYWY